MGGPHTGPCPADRDWYATKTPVRALPRGHFMATSDLQRLSHSTVCRHSLSASSHVYLHAPGAATGALVPYSGFHFLTFAPPPA